MPTDIDLAYIGDYTFRVLKPIKFKTDIGELVVPDGFVTDLASTPRLTWWLLPPHGKYIGAAILHDWLYVEGSTPKSVADKVFKSEMQKAGVPRFKRNIMYWTVRLFGNPV